MSAELKIGQKLKGHNPRVPTCHIRGFVDGLIVVRWWNRYKQRWFYDVCHDDTIGGEHLLFGRSHIWRMP